MAEITAAELLAAYQDFEDRKREELAPKPGFHTRTEWAAYWGIKERTASERIEQAREMGWVEERQVRYRRRDGQRGIRMAYKIEEPVGKPKKRGK